MGGRLRRLWGSSIREDAYASRLKQNPRNALISDTPVMNAAILGIASATLSISGELHSGQVPLVRPRRLYPHPGHAIDRSASRRTNSD